MKRRKKRKKKMPLPPDVLEFAQNLERLERQNIPILPEHPKPH